MSKQYYTFYRNGVRVVLYTYNEADARRRLDLIERDYAKEIAAKVPARPLPKSRKVFALPSLGHIAAFETGYVLAASSKRKALPRDYVRELPTLSYVKSAQAGWELARKERRAA